MKAAHFILFVADQDAATSFFAEVLDRAPRLHVPGMTEFELAGGAVLGLMPEGGIERLLPRLDTQAAGVSRAEIYLVVDDPEAHLARAVGAGAELLAEVGPRDWGHRAGYCRDANGHVLAFATEG